MWLCVTVRLAPTAGRMECMAPCSGLHWLYVPPRPTQEGPIGA
jgi:hypothetical protein